MQVTQFGTPYPQVILFGDSITEQSASQEHGFAWMPALQDACIRRYDVINRGFSGYNTTWALDVLPKFMPRPEQADMRIMTIFFGANDACLPDSASGQHVPLETFKANLRAIVTHPAVLAQKAVVMLVSPPPLDEYLTEEHNTVEGEYTPQRTANHTKLYADACKDIASELNVTHIDLWRSMMIKAGWKEGDKLIPGSKELPRNSVLRDYLSDGLHLNPAGYRVLFEETMRAIGEHHALQTPNEIPYHSPLWRDLPKYDSTRA